MEITEAAQDVQRSAFPDAYADHEADARALASALTGNHAGGVLVRRPPGTPRRPATASTTPGSYAARPTVRAELESVFGPLSLGGFAPGGVSTGHMEGSAHYEGRAIDVFVRPITRGQQAARLGDRRTTSSPRPTGSSINTVIFDDRIWHGRRAQRRRVDRLRRAVRPRRGDRAILEHRDHVHVDVAD